MNLDDFLSLELFYIAKADGDIIEGDAVEKIPEAIHVDDSSLEPPPQNKKPRNPGTGTRKIPAIPRIAHTPKVRKEKKVPTGHMTDATRKLDSNESSNSSPGT